MSAFDELIGHDLNRKMAEFVKESSKDFDRERRERQDLASRAVTMSDELWLMLTKLGNGWVKAECVSGLPEGVSSIEVQGTSADDCVFQVRWELVGALRKAKLCATQEDARSRASRADIRTTGGM